MKQFPKNLRVFLSHFLILAGLPFILTEAYAQNIQPHDKFFYAATSPLGVVEEFQSTMISTMKVAHLGTTRQRYNNLKPTLSRLFHLPLMVQIVTGNYWSTATRYERERLSLAFTHMSASTIATLLSEYQGENFKTVSQMPGPQNTSLVTSHLVRPGRRTIAFTYVVRMIEGRWKIIDAIVDHKISELKLRRSEYSHTLKAQGIPGLIRILNDKANELLMQDNLLITANG